jgi:chemotaxis protein MotA
MDISTVTGIVTGILFVALAILAGDKPQIFINVQGFLIVVGGTLATTLMRFPLASCLNMVNVVKNAFFHRLTDPGDLIEELVQLARKSRQEGLLSLEDYKSDDPFMAQGIQLVVDGNEPDTVEELLETNIRCLKLRHRNGQDILKAVGEAAPAFGMIGTLIGLVIMLTNMEDVKALGPAMAIAILTTLYGALIANLIALPLVKKLEIRSEQETLNRELMLVGLLNILRGENPRMIETQLRAFLAKRGSLDDSPKPQEVKAA